MFEHLGQVIKDTIFIKNMNQKQVAKELSIAPQTFNAYLNNRRVPSLYIFSQIMEFLEIDANEALELYTRSKKRPYDAFLYYTIQQLSIDQQKIIIDLLQYIQHSSHNLQRLKFL